jgi:hypothetical protein
VDDLRLRCFVAVCVEQRYFYLSSSRLGVLCVNEQSSPPLLAIAKQLFVVKAMASQGEDAGNQADINEHTNPIEDKAEDDFERLKNQHPTEYDSWIQLTRSLLETLPLGLPESSLRTLLRHEFGVYLEEPELKRLRRLLIRRVIPEVEQFLEDRGAFLFGARLGLSSDTVIREFYDIDHPETKGSELRNDMANPRRRQKLMSHLRSRGIVKDAQGNDLRRNQETLEYRLMTPGGRLTLRASQATAQQLGVLLTADEVMLEVAYELVASGHRLLGLADDEFLVEVPDDRAEVALGEVRVRATAATARILGTRLAAPVTVAVADRW